MKNILLVGLVCLFGSGCAYIDQHLVLDPMTNVSSSNIGASKKIDLKIVDDREDQIVGRRTTGEGINGAKIVIDGDLADILRQPIIEGLRKKGFEPVQNQGAVTSLKVELRALKYTCSMGLWTGGNMGNANIKVIAQNSTGKTFEKSYRGQNEIRTAFVGSQETNAKVVNAALSQALEKLFADDELMKFLAE